MNIVKKITVATIFLCAATVANAQEGITFGARLGYSLQSVDGGTLFASEDIYEKTDVNMGLLGIGASVVANIPAGPVVIAPEIGFLYRTNANIESKYDEPGYPSETYKSNQKEFAISVPIMIKFFPIEALYIAAGFQIDIPLAAEWCYEDGEKECYKLNGKTETRTDTDEYGGQTYTYTYDIKNPERASVDLGIPMGIGYMITPNLGVDFRFVLGLNDLVKYEDEYEDEGIKYEDEYKTGTMKSFGIGLTYLF